MTGEPSPAVKLFGTDEATIPPRLLRAGRVTAELDSGNLRHIVQTLRPVATPERVYFRCRKIHSRIGSIV
jgi:hypothetical protein